MLAKVKIYTGPIHRIFAQDISLVHDKIFPVIGKEVVKPNASFYHNNKGYINLEYGLLLASEEEASDFLESSFDAYKYKIRAKLLNPKLKENEKREVLHMLHLVTACVFYDPHELKSSKVISKSEFKVLAKQLKNK